MAALSVGVAQPARARDCGSRDPGSTPGAHPTCLDCDRPAKVRGRCRRCELRHARGSDPRRYLRFTGQPCICGCGRPARGRSGLAKTCYNRGFYRDRRWQTVVRRVLGVPMDVRQVQVGLAMIDPPRDPQAAEALKVCRMLLVEMAQGRLSLMRNPWEGRR